jgi:hypothetical protein
LGKEPLGRGKERVTGAKYYRSTLYIHIYIRVCVCVCENSIIKPTKII